MGAWGYNPKDNDGAADLFYEVVGDPVMDRLNKLLHKRATGSQELWERLGVVQMVLDTDQFHMSREVVRAAQKCLDIVEKDDDWMDAWDDPAAVKRHIKSMRTALRNTQPHH